MTLNSQESRTLTPGQQTGSRLNFPLKDDIQKGEISFHQSKMYLLW